MPWVKGRMVCVLEQAGSMGGGTHGHTAAVLSQALSPPSMSLLFTMLLQLKTITHTPTPPPNIHVTMSVPVSIRVGSKMLRAGGRKVGSTGGIKGIMGG